MANVHKFHPALCRTVVQSGVRPPWQPSHPQPSFNIIQILTHTMPEAPTVCHSICVMWHGTCGARNVSSTSFNRGAAPLATEYKPSFNRGAAPLSAASTTIFTLYTPSYTPPLPPHETCTSDYTTHNHHSHKRQCHTISLADCCTSFDLYRTCCARSHLVFKRWGVCDVVSSIIFLICINPVSGLVTVVT
jgi:hypothetical protein